MSKPISDPKTMLAVTRKLQIISSLTILVVVYCTVHVGFGGPWQIWFIDGFALLLGFGVPSLLVSSPRDLATRRVTIAVFLLAGLISWDVLMTLFTAKHELFRAWGVVYPVGSLTLASLLVVHGFVVGTFHDVHPQIITDFHRG